MARTIKAADNRSKRQARKADRNRRELRKTQRVVTA